MGKQNRYIYHYCAAQGNATVSGIAQLTFRIVSQEDLNTLKQIVSDDLSFQAVAIISLSYLGRENEEIARPTPAADLAELVPDGWKLVPGEPTEEMLRAWRGDMYKSYAKIHIEHIGDDEIGFAYSAMLEAAPTPHE
ncbi:hypothetical protein LZU96_21345 (plasmid) [Pantoea agglomerans]|uniref:hypothetical protein n=1 Tax=Enterobacter agglomerans TaxID=549 RepID=UPI001F22FE07|nr:hypothetical protein [Pantoea agglomerans]UIL54694.1 hypothetical protein LZU96_21345 [Pantoea agglomerans]